MISVKVTVGSKKKIKINLADLLDKTLIELVEEKLGKEVNPNKIKSVGDSVEIFDGEDKILEIQENDLIKQSIEQVVKKELELKSLKNVEIAIIGESIKKSES